MGNVAVESVMSPEGVFKVRVRLDVGDSLPGRRIGRWTLHRVGKHNTADAYMEREQARLLANELLQASGYHPGVRLEEEKLRLRKELAAPDLDYSDRQHLETCVQVIDLMRRLLLAPKESA